MLSNKETGQRPAASLDAVTPAGAIGVRRAALAGMVGPALFAVALVVITWAERDYLEGLGFSLTDHGDTAWPSGLAQGPHGWAQIVNYGVLGVLLMVFYLSGLRSTFHRRLPRGVATVLLTGSAVGWILVASPEDGPPFGEPTTAAGFVHALGFSSLVLFTMTGMAATAVALRGNRTWRLQAQLSVVAAVATFCFLFVLVFLLEVATTLGIYGFFATILLWAEVLAVHLYRESTR